MDAALKHTGNDHSADESNTKPDAKLKERAARLGHVHQTVQPNNRGLAKYGKNFWDADTSTAPCHAAPPASSSTSLHWRSLFGSLRFSTRSADAPQSIPLQPRRWNFNLFSVGNSVRTIGVAAGRKKNASGFHRSFLISWKFIHLQRIAIAPPTAAELAAAEAAAAMQHTNGNKAGSSTPPGQPQALLGTQVSQGRPTETQGAGGETGKVSYEVRCCGLFFSCGRPTSHQS
ncbi:uncharacterized protein BJ212DRAFT_1381776 [Suillus subaureus]|uniref:Uncharacterized protein n=1 Tax=Suillus subaureus TaxID=48587 RepID=A0A9P7E257_9AGAM|nr:uncharacterized protein BJ212DRAFT_1381776 [Suillus subaureus]KAG1808979.1 hypothetical protein BJ212DRAFT_1381776 [Suillus subaureus]